MPYDTPFSPIGISVRKSLDLEDPTAFEQVAACNFGTCDDTPTVIEQHGSAGNNPVISNDAQASAPCALTANGYGDLAITGMAFSARMTGYELYHAARVHRAFVLERFLHRHGKRKPPRSAS